MSFGGGATTTNTTTENVTQPVGSASGAGSNVAATSGNVTFNQESPAAFAAVSGAVQALETVAGAAVTSAQASNSDATKLAQGATSSQTQQLTPIILGIAVVIGAIMYFRSRK